ncbi:hypothetical protein [Colwellia sp. E2M01]|uniref:COG3014 family protein n=1 Tax=Colwellia sp. E2M01 TaxID=2841561 RepID=UPI001C08E944|nr:hypothetical protein [Colwellia sp. E2M01]MBU2870822.1 hypothetical protein [Colwellia sp. E2M01]
MLNILLKQHAKKVFKLFTPLLLSLSVAACSSTGFGDLFSNYNQQMQGVKVAQKNGDFQQAISLIPARNENDGTYSLTLLEKGRLEYLAMNTSLSQQDLEKVYQRVKEQQQAAKIQLSRQTAKVASVVTNDNAMSYDVPYYEQSMLNSYQALNYLNQQDLSGALVEIRRANIVQNNALKANRQSIEDSQKKMADEGISQKTLNSKYPAQSTAIGQVKNGFQNAYTFYLSGVLYEAAGQVNDAYIDYKKALEIYPSNTTVQKDVWRLANQLAMSNDIEIFTKRFAPAITQSVSVSNNGQLVLIVEQGIVNSKQQVSLSLPIFSYHNNVRFYNVALPVYPNTLQKYSGVSLSYQGKNYQSEEIVRLQSLAAKQLQDNMPGIVTRQIVRLVAKEQIRKQAARKGGDIGNILANLYNIVSEKADTRSWSTLPDSIEILRVDLAAGQHDLTLNINGNKQTITVNINPNRQTLVTLTAIDRYTNYQTINL